MSDRQRVFNGIDGDTGAYLLDPMSDSDIAGVAAEQPMERDDQRVVGATARTAGLACFVAVGGIDSNDLAQTGWAAIFAEAEAGSALARRNAEVREAMAPLLDWRRAQASAHSETYYREYSYRRGETKQAFLARHGAGPGPADPERVPYYLMLIGSPEHIPYRVQYQLDVQYAVGRLHFDTVEEYATYARAVLAVERGEVVRPRRVAFFGVENPDDKATELSQKFLTAPLADYVDKQWGDRWTIERALGDDATAVRLRALLAEDAPAFLFTTSHGLGFSNGSTKQRPFQGALLCQDWDGPKAGKVLRDHYVGGEDIPSGADLRGMISFHFACFGMGTPARDDFARKRGQKARRHAPHDLVSRLPQRTLGVGGALAAIGHVDRAWGSSFIWHDADGRQLQQVAAFQSIVKSLLDGERVGYAMEHMNLRYAELAADLNERIEAMEYGDETISDRELTELWIQTNDARNYEIVGDPAVRLGTPNGGANRGVPSDERPSPAEVRGGSAATTAPSSPASMSASASQLGSSSSAPTVDAEIRQLGPDDVAAFHALRLRALRDDPDAFMSSYDEEAKQPVEYFADRLGSGRDDPGRAVLGAFVDGDLVGMVGYNRGRRRRTRHR
ncbi:MAG: hypothetical protein AAGC55_06910, partial [Myxococcota bacterium]